ncbi:MAG: class I SAM-dependent methyltransferase [Bacteroidota bacterium]|jgi:SAM-dependent methyltransferase|nr:class I SAM-dependent methyltransferase [Bacteroidales bacterium]
MNQENNCIHEFDIALICDYFSYVERQGPGSPEVTLKALSFINHLNQHSKIADLGCGTGGQTMVLAQNTPGTIIGIDLFPKFVEIFNKHAAELGLSDRVKAIIGSMDNLPFKEEELDLIWSEGAIYNIGYERGLNEWRRFIKKGGFVAVTEASWFTPKRPAEIEQFWLDAYPEIDIIPNKIAIMQKAGYVPVASFILPESCWTDNFFALQLHAQKHFMEKYAGNQNATHLVEYLQHEAQLYARYKDYYGYVFYIGMKI